MADNNEQRMMQEYEFVMEGITTRMQTALEKVSASVRWICVTAVIMLLLAVIGILITTQIMIKHTNDIINVSGVSAYEALSEQRQGAND